MISITDDMLCGEATGQDSCQGDSGGPFTVEVVGMFYFSVTWMMNSDGNLLGNPSLWSRVFHITPFFELSYTLLTTHALGLYEVTKKFSVL